MTINSKAIINHNIKRVSYLFYFRIANYDQKYNILVSKADTKDVSFG